MTEEGKLYVIQNKDTKLFYTQSKANGKYYWGLWKGTDRKRYGAIRYYGGPVLDKRLDLYPNIQAVEVKK